jgi:hypothetical protein
MKTRRHEEVTISLQRCLSNEHEGHLPEPLSALVVRAQAGDVDAFGGLVSATQAMAHAVAFSVLRDTSLAQDAAQEAYLRAFRRSRRGRFYCATALNGVLAIVFAHIRATRPPSVVMSRNVQVSWSTANGSFSTFIGTRATSLSAV